jgi:hypothetical protein
MATVVKTDFSALYEKADAAGKAAAEAKVPTPMVVGTETTPFSGQIDFTQKTYFVEGGLCGFAWVKFKGNTAFGKWAKASGKATKAYNGGLQVWVRGYGQSIAKKEAYAQGFSQVLREAGVTAYYESRLD